MMSRLTSFSETFRSALHAHILTDEAKQEEVSASLSSILHILGSAAPEYTPSSKNTSPVLKITPSLDDLLCQIIDKVKKGLFTDLNVPFTLLVLLNTRIKQSGIVLDQEFKSIFLQALMSKVGSAQISKDIISLFLYIDPEIPPEDLNPLLQKIEEILPVMPIGDLVSIYHSWVNRMKIHGNYKWRNYPLFKRIIGDLAKYVQF